MHSTSTPYQEIQQTMQKTTATSEHIFNKQIYRNKKTTKLYILYFHTTPVDSLDTPERNIALYSLLVALSTQT